MDDEIKSGILNYLLKCPSGASALNIANTTGYNRITVTKYLEFMKNDELVDYTEIAQSKQWYIIDKIIVKYNILIVDDEPHIAQLIRLSLNSNLYNFIIANSGEDALSKIQDKPIDVAILDLMMPGMDGFTLCQKIRENKIYSNVPIIILTARDTSEDRKTLGRIGANDFITKPFDPMELLEKVKYFISLNKNNNIITGLKGIDELKIYISLKENKETNLIESLYLLTIEGFSTFRNVSSTKKVNETLYIISRLMVDIFGDDKIYQIGSESFVAVIQDDSSLRDMTSKFNKMRDFLFDDGKIKIKYSFIEDYKKIF